MHRLGRAMKGGHRLPGLASIKVCAYAPLTSASPLSATRVGSHSPLSPRSGPLRPPAPASPSPQGGAHGGATPRSSSPFPPGSAGASLSRARGALVSELRLATASQKARGPDGGHIAHIEDHASPPGPLPLCRLGDQVQIARSNSKAGERGCFTAGQELKPERLVETDCSTHVVGGEGDRAQSLDHGGR